MSTSTLTASRIPLLNSSLPFSSLAADNVDCSLGNKYYEDMGELPLRERWVEYKVSHEYDSTQIEPGWYILPRDMADIGMLG